MCVKKQQLLTGENGAELRPAGDATLRGELAQRHLQEEDGQTSAKQEDEVRDEKGTCRAGTQHVITFLLPPPCVTR